MKDINTILIEEVYEDSFNQLKKLLIENLHKEIEKNINCLTIEDYFESNLSDKESLDYFIKSTESDKIIEFLDWFKDNSWTLSDAVYDFTREDFEGSIPNIQIEYVKSEVSERRGKFIYAVIAETVSGD